MISSATKAKLSYDSAVWLLKDTASDPGAAAEDPNCKEGNLWLGINPDYGGGDPSADTVIFDFNLPGKEAIVYTGRTPGTTISLPSVSNESTGAVTYKFRGWYTEPVGGSKLSDPLTVEAGTHVYYAQWDVQTDSGSGGGGVPGDADMYLVYFDQNYEGGGLTTAYVTAGTFSFTVEFEGPDGMETEVVEVDIPFEFPGDPARDGYTFRGWGTSADSNSPVDQGSWAPTEKVTTLYGIWEPDTYTLTWDANGGNGGTTTTQERDSRAGHARTYCSFEEQRIVVRSGLSQVQTAKTVLHEITHAILHNEGDAKTRAEKELEAESAAFVICSHYGIDTSEYTFPYLASWCRQERDKLERCLDAIQKHAFSVIEQLDASMLELEKAKADRSSLQQRLELAQAQSAIDLTRNPPSQVRNMELER